MGSKDYSIYFVIIITSESARSEGPVARMEQKRNTYRFWWGTLKEKDCLEDPDVDGTIILKRIFF